MSTIGKSGCYRSLIGGNIRNRSDRRCDMHCNRVRAFRIKVIVILRDIMVIIDLEIP